MTDTFMAFLYIGGVVASIARKRGFWNSLAWPADAGALIVAIITAHEKGSKGDRDG